MSNIVQCTMYRHTLYLTTILCTSCNNVISLNKTIKCFFDLIYICIDMILNYMYNDSTIFTLSQDKLLHKFSTCTNCIDLHLHVVYNPYLALVTIVATQAAHASRCVVSVVRTGYSEQSSRKTGSAVQGLVHSSSGLVWA